MEEYLAGLNPLVTADFAITSFTITGTGHLVVTWEGADSPAVATSLTAQGYDTVGGTPAAIPGSAVFAGTTWTWTSTDPVAATTKFIQLSATDGI